VTEQNAKCFSCDELFLQVGDDACPSCGSTIWTPHNPDYTITSEADGDEFSGSKEVDEWEFATHERDGPQPNVQELHIQTEDEWEYIFREPNPDDGYELYQKRRPDDRVSDDDVVPVTVAEYIDSMTVAALNYAKLVIHPSDEVYTAPGN